MNASRCIALLLMAGALCGVAADEAKPPKYKMAADFKSCPDGHKALKDIPIVWGLAGPLYKKPADYNDEDRKLLERVRKGEVVLGNDIVPPDPPATRVVCQKCGFEYNPDLFSLEGSLRTDAWDKGGKRPDEFKIPFSKMLLGFPLMRPVEGTLSYSQSLDAAGKILKHESVSFRTPQKLDATLATVRKWMSENGRDAKNLKRVSESPGNYDYKDNYVWLMVQDDVFWNPGQINVSLFLNSQEAGKSIKISEDLPPGGDPFGPPAAEGKNKKD